MITVDVTFRRGRPIPMGQVAAEAAESCSSLQHLIVSRRRGADAGPTQPVAGGAWRVAGGKRKDFHTTHHPPPVTSIGMTSSRRNPATVRPSRSTRKAP